MIRTAMATVEARTQHLGVSHVRSEIPEDRIPSWDARESLEGSGSQGFLGVPGGSRGLVEGDLGTSRELDASVIRPSAGKAGLFSRGTAHHTDIHSILIFTDSSFTQPRYSFTVDGWSLNNDKGPPKAMPKFY